MPLDLTKLDEQHELIELYRKRQSQHRDDFFDKVTAIFGDDFEYQREDEKRTFKRGWISFVLTFDVGKEYNNLTFTIDKKVWGKVVESLTLKDETEYFEDEIIPYSYLIDIGGEEHSFDESALEPLIQSLLNEPLKSS